MGTRRDLENLSLDALADALSETTPNNVAWGIVAAEFQRRAAVATDDVATATKQSAHWMKWSVVAIAITSGLQALFAFLNWYYPGAPH